MDDRSVENFVRDMKSPLIRRLNTLPNHVVRHLFDVAVCRFLESYEVSKEIAASLEVCRRTGVSLLEMTGIISIFITIIELYMHVQQESLMKALIEAGFGARFVNELPLLEDYFAGPPNAKKSREDDPGDLQD